MEFLQRLAESVLTRIQLKIYGKEILSKYENLFDTELFGFREAVAVYEELIQEDSEDRKKYQFLIDLCGGNDYARWLVDFCITALLYPQFHAFSMEYWNGITLDVVAEYVEQELSYKELKKTW